MAAIGLLACRLAVVEPGTNRALDARLGQALGIASAFLVLGALAILISRTLQMNGGSWQRLVHDVPIVLAQTHYGAVWLWRLPALVVLWLAWAAGRHYPARRWSPWLMLLAVAVIAMTRADTGHAEDHGDLQPQVWVDWLHLMAGGAWVGSLLGMTLVVFPQLRGHRHVEANAAARIFGRLSTLSGAALGALLGAGIYLATQRLNHFHDLWTTRYGVALGVKILIVAGMVALGASNRYLRLPRLRQSANRPPLQSPFGRLFRQLTHMSLAVAPLPVDAQWRSCARAVLWEAVLGLGAIGAASVLLHAMPPADAPPPRMHARASGVQTVTPEAQKAVLQSASAARKRCGSMSCRFSSL